MINYKAIKRPIKNMFNRKNNYRDINKVKYTCFYDNHIKIKTCINCVLYNTLVSKKNNIKNM